MCNQHILRPSLKDEKLTTVCTWRTSAARTKTAQRSIGLPASLASTTVSRAPKTRLHEETTTAIHSGM